MATQPRKPVRRALHTRYGIKTGEPGSQIVDTGSQRATYDTVGSYRGLYLVGGFPTPTVDIYVDEGKGWQLYERLDFEQEGRR